MYEVHTNTESKSGKSRSFSAQVIGYVAADWMLGGSSGERETKPVWVAFAGSEQALRPFMANVRLGRLAQSSASRPRSGDGQRLLLQKGAGYRVDWQRTPHGSLAVAYVPELFRSDPGMVDPAGAWFVLMPALAWLDVSTHDVEPPRVREHIARVFPEVKLCEQRLGELLALSALFSLYLDRRTRLPLVADVRFSLQLLVACLRERRAQLAREGVARWFENGLDAPGVHDTKGTEALGLAPPLLFAAQHDQLSELLSEQTSTYFREVR